MEPIIDCCDGDQLNSDEQVILDLDLVNMKKEEVEFSTPYKVTFNMNDNVHALVAWFDCEFSDLENPIILSTAPYNDPTHWR